MLILPAQINHLRRLAIMVQKGESLARIKCACQIYYDRSNNGSFAYFYVGVLLASSQRQEDALKILGCVKSDACAQALARHLKKGKSIKSTKKMFESTKPFDLWCKSSFCQYEERRTVSSILKLLQSISHPILPNSTVVDIGTGNGKLLSLIINRLVRAHRVKQIQLVLFDESSEMLRVARKTCEKSILIPVKINAVKGNADNFSKATIGKFHLNPPSFILAAACLHHLKRQDKIRSLKNLRLLNAPVFLVELEANHDLPRQNSTELVFSVWKFYGFLISNLLRSQMIEKNKFKCIDEFLAAEALAILFNKMKQRGNFHTFLKEWQLIAREAGFRCIKAVRNVILPRGPASLVIFLKPSA